MTTTYLSPAKINLSLDIIGVRADSYHELQSVVHCIGLYDVLTFDFDFTSGIEFHCTDTTLESNDNLVCHATRAWLEAAESCGLKDFAGVRITLQKNIPCGAGLGGGSGNAATTLRALNDYAQCLVAEEKLISVAARLGADVPLFLRGGCVLMEGIGEKLTPLPTLEGAVVVIVPNQHASTPAVYQCFDKQGKASVRSMPSMVEAVNSNDLTAAASNLENDLSAAAVELGIDVELPARLLQKHGALGAQCPARARPASACFLIPKAQSAPLQLCATTARCQGNTRFLLRR